MIAQLPLGLAIKDSATFANFIPGPQQEALQSVQASAAGAGEPLIYLAGAAATGKTHLLQAACHAAGQEAHAVAYVPLRQAADFGTEILDGLDQLRLVCIDDLHAIAGQTDWEHALFDLFNRLRERGGRLIVAATRKPAQLEFVLPDLSSRLSWGVTYVLQALSDTDKLAALHLRAAARGFELPEDVGQYLLARLPRDMHALFAVLDQLDTASLAAQRRLTLPFTKSVLE